LSWDYGTYTWHTNRDTFDKVSFDDVKMNATMTAMLVYLAAEDPDPMPRDRRVMPTNQQGNPTQWPACSNAARQTP
ncbi:MAG TPA: peptidase M28, partial [Gemmatimonadales bacterium]|nr:peptidase M28 [Gemmatimonadales bacterium]